MRSIESEGDSIDQAIESALRTLRVERDRVEIEILSDSTRGLFGFGSRKARVRATVRAPLFTPDGMDSRETSPRPASASSSAPVVPSAERPGDIAGPGICTGPVGIAGVESHSRAVLEDILRHLGVQCTVEVRPGSEDGAVTLDVRGDGGGLLIGRRGQTLDALEYLVNRIITRDEQGSARVTIDVERYRERRGEYLRTLARRLADKARQTGRGITLNPMSPRDRRIVHLTLNEDPTVSTSSHGQGYYRKVLILPGERGRRGSRGVKRG
jgi:spoIIIJ-associated protein